MYFKNFPQFLYDFNYDGGNKKIKTSVVTDVTRNVRFRKDILSNVQMYDYYDIVDGETPEIISEKFYGTPFYHWIIMLVNDKYDYRNDFPLPEPILQRHISTHYNPTLTSVDWYWTLDANNRHMVYLKITSGTDEPFDVEYLTAPVKITIRDDDKSFVKIINFPVDEIGLDSNTQYFYFPIDGVEGHLEWLLAHGKEGATDSYGVGKTPFYIETEGRENNPIYFINSQGMKVNATSPGAVPVTGDYIHRAENDLKRKIKIVSPSIIEMVIKNYEEQL